MSCMPPHKHYIHRYIKRYVHGVFGHNVAMGNQFLVAGSGKGEGGFIIGDYSFSQQLMRSCV